MKILISHLLFVRPPRNFVFYSLERAYYNLFESHTLIPVPNTVIVPDYDYDCLVLTGGPDSLARNNTENKLFNHALEKAVPIIGICHGAFAINDIVGGINGSIEGHVDQDIEIHMEGKNHIVKCFHSQSIESLAVDYEALAHDLDGNIEAFKHKVLPIYGIVWHPERMEVPVLPSEVKKLLD